MTRSPAAIDIATVRRRDRAVTDDAWIAEALRTAAVGTLATVDDGQPFLNANLFAFDAARRAIYLHTARRGRTRSNVEQGRPVCFAVHEMGRLLPADTALEFSVEYAGVVVFGTATVVEDAEEATSALQMILDKYAPHLRPGRDYRGITPDELARTTVMRVDISAWSGKRKMVATDFPGAYRFPERSLLSPSPGAEPPRP
jgi:uncharacterized protein